MQDLKIQLEKFDSVFPEMYSHLVNQHEENETLVDGIDLLPDEDIYRTLEEGESLDIITSRVKGVLVGYIVCVTAPDLHHKGYKVSTVDVVYVCPYYRKSSVAHFMLEFLEELLIRKESTWLRVAMKVKQRFDKLLLAHSMECDEVVYAKRLG